MGRDVRWASLISAILLASVPPAALAAAYTFTPIDVPFAGVTATEANGSNSAGQIVGTYNDANGTHGFLDTGGMFVPVDVPFTGVLNTFAEGINDRGQIVGFYSVGTTIHGF